MTGTQNTAQVDKLLTNLSNKIVPLNYISEQILPLVNVVQSSGLIGSYGNSHLRIESDVTGGKNKYPQVQTRVYETQVYNITKHGLSDIVTEEDIANVESPFDAMSDTTDELTTKLWLGKEKGLADAITSTSVLTNNVTLSGTDQLSDYVNSDPLDAFSDARNAIYNKVGGAPDTAIMSWETWQKLRYHPKIVRALGFADNRPGGLQESELASVLEVKRLLIGAAVYNSAKEGQADSIAPVWGKDIVFAVCPQSSAKRQVSLGYRFQQFGAPRRVFKNKIDNPPNATEILVDDSYQQLISQANAGYLIKDAIA